MSTLKRFANSGVLAHGSPGSVVMMRRDAAPKPSLIAGGRAMGQSIAAEEIEVDDLDRTELRGVASNVDPAAGILSILGVAIVTDAQGVRRL